MKQRLQKIQYRVFEKLRPQTAEKIAAKLWFTPSKYASVLPERLLLEAAAKKRIPFGESRHQKRVDTYYTLYSWGKGPIVLLVHGWGGGAAQMTTLCKPLIDAGFQVLAFDAFAHGESPGERTDVFEIQAIIEDVVERFERVHAIIGYSLGALAVVKAVENGAQTNMVVTVNCAASLDYYFRQFTTGLNVVRPMAGRIAMTIKSHLGRSMTELSLLQIVPSLKCRALIVHDQNDEVVDYREALALAKCWPRSELFMTSGLGHTGFLHDTATVARMVQCMGKGEPAAVPATVDPVGEESSNPKES